MKILLVNTLDTGGAAKACIRLHQGLLTLDLSSKLLLAHQSQKQLPNAYQFQALIPQKSIPEKAKNKLIRILKELRVYPNVSPEIRKRQAFLASLPKGWEIFSFPFSPFDIFQSPHYQEADLINLHWIANFLDFPSFFKKNKKPIIWTLHDMNPFTGGEHYIYEKELNSPNETHYLNQRKKYAQENLQLKIEALRNHAHLTIVSPSHWLSQTSQESTLFKNYPHHTIPYGLDSQVFQPRDREFARDLLGIPQHKTVFLFVAQSLHQKRKGWVYLQQAIEALSPKYPELFLCSTGNGGENLQARHNYKSLGFIHDELLMSIIYSAADLFIIPSLSDNLPNTVLESLMCGTPVVGFPIGGNLDMIEANKNGYLAETVGGEALIATLEKFLQNPHQLNRANIRTQAIKKYDLTVQARAYEKLYQQIMANPS